MGGERADEIYPYQISLQVKPAFYLFFIPTTSPDGWTHNCGGSIVTERHVVTAAHCLKGYEREELSVWAGTSDLNGRNGRRHMVASYTIHPNYVELNTSDIGIITVSEPFEYSDRVSANLSFEIILCVDRLTIG